MLRFIWWCIRHPFAYWRMRCQWPYYPSYLIMGRQPYLQLMKEEDDTARTEAKKAG